MENTYWDKKGTHQELFEKFSSDLMPPSGNCDTLAGEFIRAANKLYWDFYNNGMGNNTSGALNFLTRYFVVKPSTYSTIKPYTTGRCYEGNYRGDAVQKAIEELVDTVVEYIVANEELITRANDEDMFTYEDEYDFY